jgi:hypothetical protein
MKAAFCFVVAFLSGFAGTVFDDTAEPFDSDPGDIFTHNEIVQAYCNLVKRKDFYRWYDLRENCALYVKIYGKEVIFEKCTKK